MNRKIDDLIQQLDEIKNGIAYAAGDYQYDSDASDLCSRVLEMNKVLLAIVKMLAEQMPSETKAKEDDPQWVVFNGRYGQQTVINLSQVHAMTRTQHYSHLWFADGQDTIPETVYDALVALLKPRKISDEG